MFEIIPQILSARVTNLASVHYASCSFIIIVFVWKPADQLPCHLTYTTPGVEKVVHESLHMNSHIQQDTKGPRYSMQGGKVSVQLQVQNLVLLRR